jgi:hypothetical protein
MLSSMNRSVIASEKGLTDAERPSVEAFVVCWCRMSGAVSSADDDARDADDSREGV